MGLTPVIDGWRNGSVYRSGMILVLSSPSGAGKTTLSKRILETDAEIQLSVSLTTRRPRDGEIDGKDYHFVDHETFLRQRDDGQLLEWAEVFGNYYGTPRAQVEADIAAGRDLLFDIDWQGARQIAATLPSHLVRVFILPPSAAVLEQRLRGRGKDSDEVVGQRMARAAAEISHWDEYDYVIVNDDLDRSTGGLRAILAAERLRRSRQPGLQNIVETMQAGL
ncbi:MAG: guanylate kinase [Hyphomicrobiaceae bacterium]|nr:guanylate kinase [Hyphomicrobiaceae bacterium]